MAGTNNQFRIGSSSTSEVSPVVPTPTDPTHVANKAYVDANAGSISNITEIPNRSYNDLQDLPVIFKPFKLVDTHSVIPEDKDYILLSSGDVTLPATGFSQGEFVEGISFESQNDILGSSITTPVGFLPKIRNGGRYKAIAGGSGQWFLQGDLIEEFSVRQSPDGTLWKISVDNTGEEVITAL